MIVLKSLFASHKVATSHVSDAPQSTFAYYTTFSLIWWLPVQKKSKKVLFSYEEAELTV